uniref:Uncharacterized protein n=1 Tax=Hanusia phi TaxID=3032 RepID=A0A7S0HEA4_9CRYP
MSTIVQAPYTIGAGTIFGRPTPAQLLNYDNDADEESDSHFMNLEDLARYEGEHATLRNLGTVTFFDRRTRTRMPPVDLLALSADVSRPIVRVTNENMHMYYSSWLDMTRSSLKDCGMYDVLEDKASMMIPDSLYDDDMEDESDQSELDEAPQAGSMLDL